MTGLRNKNKKNPTNSKRREQQEFESELQAGSTFDLRAGHV